MSELAGGPRHRKAEPARPYSWVDGRTTPAAALPMEARVRTTQAGRAVPPRRVSPQWIVVDLCRAPRSIAEVAAHLCVPLGEAQVLVADLLSEGLVVVQATVTEETGVAQRRELIERVLSGLHAI